MLFWLALAYEENSLGGEYLQLSSIVIRIMVSPL